MQAKGFKHAYIAPAHQTDKDTGGGEVRLGRWRKKKISIH